ncbi:MAG: alpha/beta hydrolase [Vicinamibacterales bacterium]
MLAPPQAGSLARGQATPAQSPCSVVGDLELVPFQSQVFANQRMLRVWLPPGYRAPQNRREKYAVLYLNDGQDVFNACTSVFNAQEWQADETATRLIESGEIQPLIIVGVDNAGKKNRPREYLPFPDDTLRPIVLDVHGQDYPRFLVDEVMPFINQRYRTKTDAPNTALGGSSYGAGIALYAAIMKPGRFGKLLLESPSLYAHDDYLIHLAESFHRWPSKIFIGVGTVNEPLDDVRRLEAILRKSGIRDDQLQVLSREGAGHDERAWAERLPIALRFMFGSRKL